jgi:hypothetical protein
MMSPRFSLFLFLFVLSVITVSLSFQHADASHADPEHRPVVTLRLFHAEPLFEQGFRVTVRFRNWTDEHQVVFYPGDGSLEGRLPPFYHLILSTSKGEVVKPDCTWCRPTVVSASAVWPRDYLLDLPPFATRSFTLEVPFPTVAPGEYTLGCEYEMPVTSSRSDKLDAWPVWFGRTNRATTTAVSSAKR